MTNRTLVRAPKVDLAERPTQFHLKQRGLALVVILVILVLVAGLIVAFFSYVTARRQVATAQAAGVRANILARGAVDSIISDFQQEIQSGSIAPVTTPPLYQPADRAKMLPERSVKDAIPAPVWTSAGWSSGAETRNLIKQSASGKLFATGGASRTSGLATAATAQSSGRVPAIRWSAPRLFADAFTLADNQAPDWVYVARDGGNPAAFDQRNADRSDDQHYIVGRFAYQVYDVSGLLDLNAAGFDPIKTPAATIAQKASLALADLRAIPGLKDRSDADIQSLVAWRNKGDWSDITGLIKWGRQEGWLKPFQSSAPDNDNTIVSRSDLIRLLENRLGAGAAREALPFLTHFSREVNAPSAPAESYSPKNTSTPPAILGLVRGGKAFPSQRFALSRLSLFENPSVNAGKLRQYFCLEKRSDGLWDYIDPDTSARAPGLPTIKSLSDVAILEREPTFWEMLKAAILKSSLGVGHGNLLTYRTNQDKSIDRQILQIGLAVIDQWDSDSIPTVLEVGSSSVTAGSGGININDLNVEGVENVPYIQWFAQQHFRDTLSGPSASGEPYIRAYFMPALWNPHRNSADAEPLNYRIRARGITYSEIQTQGNPLISSELVNHNASNTIITLKKGSSTFSQISVLKPSQVEVGNTSTEGLYPPGSMSPVQVGIHCGSLSVPTSATLKLLRVNFDQPLTLTMEVEDSSGNWIPYQTLPRIETYFGNDGGTTAQITQAMNSGGFDAVIGRTLADPRATRFGLGVGGSAYFPKVVANNGNIIDNGAPIAFRAEAGSVSPPFNQQAYTPAALAKNLSGGFSVTDNGGELRLSDYALTSGYTGDGSPFGYGKGRPIILNRPFSSVAEMGYAFRGEPWKTLNLFTQNSADAALLDYFSMEETPVRAGVVNLNQAAPEVLTALLRGAGVDPLDTPSNTVSANLSSTLAAAIRQKLAVGNGAGMIFANAGDVASLTESIGQTTLPETLKWRREVIARSLSNITNTRTWNLFIDVVAQSGLLPGGADGFEDYISQGEVRLWVSLAIDRITGQVVDLQIERVTE